MGILIVKVLATWSLVALVMGLGLGAAIRRAERVRRDELLTCVFASLESLQESRAKNSLRPASRQSNASNKSDVALNSDSPARIIWGFAVLKGSSIGMRSIQRW